MCREANRTGDEDFETIAFAFAEEWEVRRGETLSKYLARYPEYERDLLILASELAVADEAAPVVTPPTDLLHRLRADARAILMPPEIESLRRTARERAGMTPPALAAALDVTPDILALLEEGGIVAATIPQRFTERVATVLRVSGDAVRRFFAMPSRGGVAGVAYHAPGGHTTSRARTFAEAVAESPLMSPEQKAAWRDR